MEYLTSALNNWFVWAIMAQIFFSFGHFLDRHLVNEFSAGQQLGMSTLFMGVAALVLLAIHFGMNYTVWMPTTTEEWLLVAGVGVLEFVWLVPYLHAYDSDEDDGGSDEATVGPLMQLTPLFAVGIGFLFFGEIISTMEAVGLGIILLGGIVLSVNLEGWAFNKRIVLLMLIATALIAAAGYLFDAVATADTFLSVLLWMNGFAFLTGILVMITVKSYRQEYVEFWKSKPGWNGIRLNVVNEIFDQLAVVATYGAIAIGGGLSNESFVNEVYATTAYLPLIILTCTFFLGYVWGSGYHRQQLAGGGWVTRSLGAVLIFGGSMYFYG